VRVGDRMTRVQADAAAFEALAADYDASFTETALGQLLRARVWHVLERTFSSHNHVLELACGTGEDALWLARRGIRITATDGAERMLQEGREKVRRAGLLDRVMFQRASFQSLIADGALLTGPYDGAFSNFGGLNTLDDLRPLSEALARRIRPGGKMVLVLMGPWCPWEIGWQLLHGEFSQAFRRLKNSAKANIGSATIPIWYPSARRLRRQFAPSFRFRGVQSLGLWLPPTYLHHLLPRSPGLFSRLNSLENRTAHLTGGWGDHYIIELERR
jgi:SAM-dependent methyltransferase